MNPKIEWMEWGRPAFDKSIKEGKSILLSITAPWCNFCDQMEDGTYSSGQVVGRLNKDFVPVRVNSDERPDLNLRYNQGGWPTTAFLTPSGQIITGAAYIPPDAFKDLMFKVTDIFKDIKIKNHEGIKAKSKKLEIHQALIL